MKNLQFEEIYNARDFSMACGKNEIKSNLLIRSGSIAGISLKDAEALLRYGVKTVIDIRSSREKSDSFHFFKNNKEIKYISIDFDANNLFYAFNNEPESSEIGKKVGIVQGYIELLENKEAVLQILRSIISALNIGGVLFHSTFGKDRVGVISMLIQSVLGISNQKIIDDYHKSYENLLKSDQIIKKCEAHGEDIIYCSPLYILKAKKYIEQKYGSAEKYVYSLGIEESEINFLRKKLLYDFKKHL